MTQEMWQLAFFYPTITFCQKLIFTIVQSNEVGVGPNRETFPIIILIINRFVTKKKNLEQNKKLKRMS